MVKKIEGQLDAKGLRCAIVVGRFNEFISQKLLDGALDCLTRHGAADGNIDVIWSPGSFETPLIAKKAATSGKYDAVLCLGAVIRGGTPHFEYVASEAAKGIAKVALDTGIPVIFGILTTETIEQAIERAGAKSGNKGWQAALSLIETTDVLKKIGK
jgi:6,7-dimethyl-8-ribityllumazine synthase